MMIAEDEEMRASFDEAISRMSEKSAKETSHAFAWGEKHEDTIIPFYLSPPMIILRYGLIR